MHYARSSRSPGKSPQTYVSHVSNVTEGALTRLLDTCNKDPMREEVLRLASLYHDLGKLLDDNQMALSSAERYAHLPVDHAEAGVSVLLKNRAESSAILVWGHHRGLPDREAELIGGDDLYLRNNDEAVRRCVDASLEQLIARHEANGFPTIENLQSKGLMGSVTLRILLSCLVDADRSDAAEYEYGSELIRAPLLRAEERLTRLQNRINELNSSGSGGAAVIERNKLRTRLFQAALNTDNPGIACLSAPVGSGKTYAVSGHLLAMAQKLNLRRLFVIAPFTNLIDQTVADLREVLILPGEDPEEVVAACHHRVEFDDPLLMRYSTDWKAPIIVTTAVTFFETLAASHPSALRKLHQVPSAGVFIDESHAAMPVWFWKQAWTWVKVLAKDWNCRFVLGSGTLVRFWEMEALGLKVPKFVIPELAPKDVREALSSYEANRISVLSRTENMDENEFVDWAVTLPMPSIFVFNTVNNAARAALGFQKKIGKGKVEHVSTALTPKDREVSINRIKTRLNDIGDQQWILSATSCVEAGMNFSFRCGGREESSFASLLQTDGRINRNGEYEQADIWSFSLKKLGAEQGFSSNPCFEESTEVLRLLLKRESISPDAVTESIMMELNQAIGKSKAREIIEKVIALEKSGRFPEVEKLFRIIRNKTLTAIVDLELVDRINKWGKVSAREIQNNSISVFAGEFFSLEDEAEGRAIPRRFKNLLIPLGNGSGEGVYAWNGFYNSFIGYMAQFLNSGPEEFIF